MQHSLVDFFQAVAKVYKANDLVKQPFSTFPVHFPMIQPIKMPMSVVKEINNSTINNTFFTAIDEMVFL